MKIKSLAIVTSIVMSFALIAAACGNDDDGIDDIFDDGTPTPAVDGTPTPTDDGLFDDDDDGLNGTDDETVSIMDGMFQPSTLNITSGTTVTFRNDGTETVQITVMRADAQANGLNGDDDDGNGLFNDDEVLSEELEAGDSTDHTFDDAGSYEVSSETDPGLQMTITVTDF